MSFLDDIKAFKEQALQDVSQATNAIVYDLFTEVVARSPSPSNPGVFAKGLLANQWWTETGGAYSPSLTSATNSMGIDSLSRISKMLAQQPFLKHDNSVSLTNNTEEAYYAEVLGWKPPIWSGRTGPYMMVASSVSAILNKYS